ncbi:MAG TPA: CocE/NonD family hydrolase [Dehalococcoidia bacterium]|nr:CocE/NonD family hydrolase [Dehalococcoidia bacterium]
MSETAGEASHEVTVLKDVMMPMRDGVRLAADIYLPKLIGGGAPRDLPALLTRTPYSKDAVPATPVPPSLPRPGMAGFGRYYASRGYAVVVQDVRGRYKSEGVWHMLTDDANDGVDTCAWIGQQAWSNGKVGMFGTSYPGGLQHIVALAGAPELKTVIPVDAVSNMGQRGMRYDGAFELRFWNWVMTGGNDVSWRGLNSPARPALAEMSRVRRDYLVNLPLRPGTTPLKHAPEYEEWLVRAMDRGCDDQFWAQSNVIQRARSYKDMPVYLVGGWYDSWGGNTTANYVALSQAIKGPVYLIMGPWIHGMQNNHGHGQVDFGPDAAIADELAWRLEWYDRWLKGIDNSVGKSAPFATTVRIFVMGTGDGRKDTDGRLNHGGYWRDEETWPLARRIDTPYYIHADGTLSAVAPVEASSSTSYDFDPRDPAPSIGGNVSSADGILLQGGYDQRGGEHIWNFTKPIPLSARRDVLVFQTQPLAEDLEVTGEMEVKLWVSSSAVDTDFTAKLIDVYPASEDYPGGFDLNLEDGIVRCRFRESLTQEKLMEPGQVYELTVRLYPTSNLFKKSHRIRLDISSSNFPRFDVNPNTGEPLNRHRRLVVATNTVFHDTGRPSHIVLPVIPRNG